VVVDGCGLVSAADEDAAFEVAFQGPAGDVGAADQRDAPVDDEDFGVQRGTGGGSVGCRPR
jgi:hypothetical protein